MFPVITTPPLVLREYLMNLSVDITPITTQDKMFPWLVPYFVDQRISMDQIQTVDFERLFNLFIVADVNLQLWIEHYFTPDSHFAVIFVSRVVESLSVIKAWPTPFFMIIFKAMMVNNAFNLEDLQKLFTGVAQHQGNEKVLKSAADLLIQLRMSCTIKFVHILSYRFLNALGLVERLFVFNYIVSDLPFLLSVTQLTVDVSKQPLSPYNQLLSLLFKTLNQVFMENEDGALRRTGRLLSLLASTLEQYIDPDLSKEMARTLFPLLPMLFTFFDSLSIGLAEDVHIIAPILLFFFKQGDRQQFRLYFEMLSYDNQLRFFDFLIAISNDDLIKRISEATSLPVINASHEIFSRILMFLSFMSLHQTKDHGILEKLFLLLAHLLKSKYQACDSFHIIFGVMAQFVTKFASEIFVDETDLITLIMATVVEITKKRFPAARQEAVGFILWLLDIEQKTRPEMTRCHLALEDAVIGLCFETSLCKPFWEWLPPPESKRVSEVYGKLVAAVNCSGMYENQIRDLLELYKEFKDFPSVRARIYRYIVQVNSDNGDMGSAFVAQWRLTALIAEIFKLKRQVIRGIPPDGLAGFPFVVDEPGIDLSVWPKDSQYLVLQSHLFTEASMQDALVKSCKLCERAGFFWLVGDITQIVFSYLEQHRQFKDLQELYNSVKEAFVELQRTESKQIGFCRIFTYGKTVAKLKFTDAIHLYPRDKLDDSESGHSKFIAGYCKRGALLGHDGLFRLEDDAEPLTKAPRNNICQICPVKSVPRELARLAARTFVRDVIGTDQGWNQPMVRRYVFQTRLPLPSCVAVAEVESFTITEIAKAQYFEDKLTSFKGKLQMTIDNIDAVMPPKQVATLWGQSVAGLVATPIVNHMNKLLQAHHVKAPSLFMLRQVFSGTVRHDSPAKIAQLIIEIRDLFIRGIRVIEHVVVFAPLSQSEKATVEIFGAYFGESTAFLPK
jgi:hypothetical protein